MSRPAGYREQAIRCVCEPGGDAAKEHAKPGTKAPAHFNAKCPHSELAKTTRRAPKVRTIKRLRLE